MTFIDFMNRFPTQEEAMYYFMGIIYPKDVVCPHCGAMEKIYRRKGKRNKLLVCNNCNNDFSILKGTIFENSRTDLKIWFYAMYQMLNSRKGFPALQLKRETGVTYKTAWRIVTQIRIAMGNEDKNERFEGIVEMDETYIGGKPRIHGGLKRGRGTNKLPVVGVLNRDSKQVYSQVMLPNEENKCLSGKQLLSIIDDNCQKGTVMITDDFRGYNILRKQASDRYTHHTVCHSQKQYSNGNGIHTNSVESFWAIVKRSCMGIYHRPSKKYMHLYMNEYDFRYNNRDVEDAFNKLLYQSVLLWRVIDTRDKQYYNTGFNSYTTVSDCDIDDMTYCILNKDTVTHGINEEELVSTLNLLERYISNTPNYEEIIWAIKRKYNMGNQKIKEVVNPLQQC